MVLLSLSTIASSRLLKSVGYAFASTVGLFLCNATFATHNRAGEITYCPVPGIPFTYDITVTTYTKESSTPADRCELEVKFGDSTKDTVQRSNGPSGSTCPHMGVTLVNAVDVKMNEYTVRHTYPGPGSYTISVEDPNRNAGVLNIGGSVNTPFYIESLVVIDPWLGEVCSPVLTLPPINNGCVGECYQHNPGAIVDGNAPAPGVTLQYSLVPCRGANGQVISTFNMPDQIQPGPNNQISIDQNGTVLWCSPQLQGEYNVAILIEMYIGNTLMGSVLRDMQITITACDNLPPEFFLLNDLCVEAGTIIDTTVSAWDPDGDLIELTAIGDPLNLTTSPALFQQPVSAYDTVSQNFYWETVCEHISNLNYQMTFTATDDNADYALSSIMTWDIKVLGPPPINLSASPLGNTIVLNWDTTACSNATGYTVYRRIDSMAYAPDICCENFPGNSGFDSIAYVPGFYNTTYTDNGGLVHGQEYCYLVVANYGSVAKSCPGNMACTELIKDIPVITHVSIFNTAVPTGTDSIIWSMPTKLNDTIWPGPYYYKVYRGIYPAYPSTPVGTTNTSAQLQLVDTFFYNTAINTDGNQYNYRVELWDVGLNQQVGSTQNASSIWLSAVPGDNKAILSWQENVPWTNANYTIYRYRKNCSDSVDIAIFDSIATTSLNTFTDTGLTNQKDYHYYVMSRGNYSSSGFINPILNNSQQICVTPYDNEAPCAPDSLIIDSDCIQGINTLYWNRPAISCADDVVAYHIYYSSSPGGELEMIASVNSAEVTTFLHDSLIKQVAGCYAVSAVDSFDNESPLSAVACVDNCPLYTLPNIFTPGNDGVNDFFIPYPYRYVDRIELQVFNRWGTLVFTTEDPDINWDGTNTATGKNCSDGVYYYVCKVFENHLSGVEVNVLKGYVHLINGPGSAGK